MGVVVEFEGSGASTCFARSMSGQITICVGRSCWMTLAVSVISLVVLYKHTTLCFLSK